LKVTSTFWPCKLRSSDRRTLTSERAETNNAPWGDFIPVTIGEDFNDQRNGKMLTILTFDERPTESAN
jgi:hypothetical protein